jgi:hypothetical protein
MDLKQNETCAPRQILNIQICRNVGSEILLILLNLSITVGVSLKYITINYRSSHISGG